MQTVQSVHEMFKKMKNSLSKCLLRISKINESQTRVINMGRNFVSYMDFPVYILFLISHTIAINLNPRILLIKA